MGDEFERPWQERRGIEKIDHNVGLVLARTSVEELGREVASRAASWERDVLGKRVKVASDFGWVFRIQGHAWATFLCHSYSREGSPAELSARLSAPVIAYDCSDTVGAISHVYELEFSSELRSCLAEGEVTSIRAVRGAWTTYGAAESSCRGAHPGQGSCGGELRAAWTKSLPKSSSAARALCA